MGTHYNLTHILGVGFKPSYFHGVVGVFKVKCAEIRLTYPEFFYQQYDSVGSFGYGCFLKWWYPKMDGL